jgi:coproporphyrinogen III oxidase-like Fe-S oxidoreductase
MCNYYVDIKSIAKKYNLQVSELYGLIKFKKDNLDDFIEDEILEFKQDIISVKESGRLFTRNIAMRFDPLIDKKIGSYSNTV